MLIYTNDPCDDGLFPPEPSLRSSIGIGPKVTKAIDAATKDWLDKHPEATTTVEDNSLTNAKFMDGSVDSRVIENESIITDDIHDLAVTTPKIADLVVTTPKIADDAVTADKIASAAADGLRTMSTTQPGVAKVGAGLAINNNGALELNGGSIAPAVTAWLNAHPEATTTVQDGSITDAKLVQAGGVLEYTEALKESLKTFAVEGNLHPYALLSRWYNGYFSTDGNIVANAANIAPTNKPFLLPANTTLVIDPGTCVGSGRGYNYDGSSYTSFAQYSFSETYTIVYDHDVYIGVNFRKTGQSSLYPADFDGDIYIIGRAKEILEILSDSVGELQANIGDTVITKTTGDNIFSKSKHLDASDGGKWYYVAPTIDTISFTPTAATGYGAVNIPIDSSNQYLSLKMTMARKIFVYYFVDSSGSILSRGSIELNDMEDGTTLEIPSGSTNLLMSMTAGNGWTGLMMVCYGSQVLPYADYVEYFYMNGYRLCELSELMVVQENLQNQIDEIIPDDLLMLPAKIDTVANDPFEIFYKGLCNAVDTDKMEFDLAYSGASINGSKGWARKFTATPLPADVGTHKLSIMALNEYGRQLDAKTVDIVVNPVPVSPASEQVILCMGDSLTTSGGWVKELRRRLIGSGGSPAALGLTNINFIGTQELADGTRYEGYGGWTFTSYSTANSSNAYMWVTSVHDKTEASDQHSVYRDSNNATWKLETIESGRIKVIRTSGSTALPSTGTLTWVSGGEHHSNIVYTASQQAAGNPFWNESEGRNDFVSYAAQFGVNHIDHCVILLGWNSTGTTETYYKGITRTFLDSLLADFPNCKITLVGLQVPSRDGMAENYGIGWKFYDKLQHVWNLQKWYQELCDSEYPTADYVCLSAQFDTEYNCLTSQKNANLRNSTSVIMQTNAVHPAPSGYLQIADAVFRSIAGRL